MADYWFNYAVATVKAFKKENPDWDDETLISETMECMELELMEELSSIEEHVREFLTETSNE